jgi:hypothetical protein
METVWTILNSQRSVYPRGNSTVFWYTERTLIDTILNRKNVNYLREALRSKSVLIIAAVAVVSLAAYAAISVVYHGGTAGRDLFAGFSKLIVSPANAQDNFTLEPTQKDSLGVSPEATYELKSKEPVDTSLIKESLKLDPPVAYSVKKISNTQWSIVPREPLPPDTVLRATLATSYTTEAGEQKEYDYSWAYQVRNTFRVVNIIPRDTATGVPVNSGIEVTFSHDSYRDLSAYFKIEPTVAGRFEKHGRTTAFVPKDPLAPGTVYTVTVSAGLPLEGSGEKLASAYTFAFETTRAESRYNSRSWLSIASAFVESPS